MADGQPLSLDTTSEIVVLVGCWDAALWGTFVETNSRMVQLKAAIFFPWKNWKWLRWATAGLVSFFILLVVAGHIYNAYNIGRVQAVLSKLHTLRPGETHVAEVEEFFRAAGGGKVANPKTLDLEFLAAPPPPSLGDTPIPARVKPTGHYEATFSSLPVNDTVQPIYDFWLNQVGFDSISRVLHLVGLRVWTIQIRAEVSGDKLNEADVGIHYLDRDMKFLDIHATRGQRTADRWFSDPQNVTRYEVSRSVVRPGSDSLSAIFSSRAPDAVLERVLSLNYSCFRLFSSCRNLSELAPEMWAEYEASELKKRIEYGLEVE